MMGAMLLGIAASARKMRKKIRWLYRHISEYETETELVPVIRIVWDDTTGKPVKKKTGETI